MPVEPPPSVWSLPDPENAPAAVGELIGVGADLEPATLLNAYRHGLFPMPLAEEFSAQVGDDLASIGWWSPDPRGVLPLDGLIVSKSLRRSLHNFEIRTDTAFVEVMKACADPDRPHGWIDEDIMAAYLRLHELGWAHSVESWNATTGELAGGLYGIAIGGLFAGESMFHRETDASKVALVGLVSRLKAYGYKLLDVQWKTEHLASLGVIDVRRVNYLNMVREVIDLPVKDWGPPGPT